MGGREGQSEAGKKSGRKGRKREERGRDEFITYFLRLLYKFYDVSVLANFFFSLTKSKYCGG